MQKNQYILQMYSSKVRQKNNQLKYYNSVRHNYECNLEDEGELQCINTISLSKQGIIPKFIRELNVKQNIKHKKQLLKYQKDLTKKLKEFITNNLYMKDKIQQQQNKTQNRQSRIRSMGDKNYATGKTLHGEDFRRTSLFNVNGNIIVAQIKNQQLYGDVQIQYKNGVLFKGRYEYGIRVKGNFIFKNGYQYNGGFLGDSFKGYGQLKLPNGNVLCGQWLNGQLIDKAQIRYNNGEIYYGTIHNFKKHGQGYLFLNNNQKYIGQFKQGHITGYGQYFKDQVLFKSGFWQNGEQIQQKKKIESSVQQSIQKNKQKIDELNRGRKFQNTKKKQTVENNKIRRISSISL